MSPSEYSELLGILDERAGAQRGKPRSRTPDQNPLGGQIFDLDCGWLMYRTPYNGSFRYVCGLYQQSHAGRCHHNHADGPLATKFVLSCMRQRLLSPGVLEKVEARLREFAAPDAEGTKGTEQLTRLQSRLTEVAHQLETVKRNMALAQGRDQFAAISGVFEELEAIRKTIEKEITEHERVRINAGNPDDEVAAAMRVARNLATLSDDPQNFRSIGEAFQSVNVRLFLRFRDEKAGKRSVRRAAGGRADVRRRAAAGNAVHRADGSCPCQRRCGN